MKMKLGLISLIVCSFVCPTLAQIYTKAVDEYGYYLGLTDLQNLENNRFYKNDIKLCNDWFEENNLDELLQVKNFKIEDNMLCIFIEAKDPLVSDKAFYKLWSSIAKSYLIQYKKSIAVSLFESFSFTMTTPREYISILVAKTKDSPVTHEMTYYDGDVEMKDLYPMPLGKGIIDIPIINLSIKDLPKKEIFKADELRKITKSIHTAFVNRFSKKESYYLYFFTTSPIPESGLGDAEMYFYVYNLKGEVLKDGSWEYLRVKIELAQVKKNGEALLEVSYNLSGRYGSGIVNSPSDWKDYYSMEIIYDDEMERYEKYEIEPLIKKAITIRP
jgi:hypothetical protein